MLNYSIQTTDYMYVVLTHECNRNCPFCIDKYRNQCEFITEETLMKYINFAKEKKISVFTFVGGEPLLHPNIVNLCKLVKQANIKIVLTTNADNMGVMKQLDGIVDSFNISFYNQNFINFKTFISDVTLSVILWKDRFLDLAELDCFIDKMKTKFYYLKFKVIEDSNEWTHQRLDIANLINQIPFEKYITLFGAVKTGIYRDIPFGISVLDKKGYAHAYKGQVDGEISLSWEREKK